MVSVEEQKRAFRIAYDALISHPNPEHTAEYFRGVCSEFYTIVANEKNNKLLPFLLSGIYDYLAEEAKQID